MDDTAQLSTKWIVGIAAIVFDIDVGQRVDKLAPSMHTLTDEEMQAVAFHAFPDSMSMELHAKTSVRDTCFWFRVRRSQQARQQQAESNTQYYPTNRFLYGFVFCRQRQDETLPRGGEQISVVVLSEHPFSSVLRPLSQVAGPLYFSHGEAALQQVYQEVCAWPSPTAAGLLQLQVSFNTLPGRLPPFDTLPHPSCYTAEDMGLPMPRQSSAQKSGSLYEGGVASVMVRVQSGGSGGGIGLGTGRKGTAGSNAQINSLLEGFNSGSAPQLTSQHLSGEFMLNNDMPSAEQTSTGSLIDQALGGGQISAPNSQTDMEHAQSSVPDFRGGQGGTSAGVLNSNSMGLHNGRPPLPQTPQSQSQVLSPSDAASAVSVKASQMPRQSSEGQTIASFNVPSSPTFNIHGAFRVGMRTSISRTSLHSVDSQSSLDTLGKQTASVIPVSVSQITAASVSSQNLQATSAPGTLASTNNTNPNLPKRLSTGLGDTATASAGAFCDADIFTPLQAHLAKLWQLWEMVLLAKPLVVVGPSPADCSSAIAALISLVAPLPYAPDFRPYYTIHDSAFAALAAGALPGPQDRSVPTLLGITNLYFVKALSHWPNIMSVGRKEQANSWCGDGASSGTGGTSTSSTGSSVFNTVKALRQRAQGAQSLLGGHIEAMWCQYKPVIRPDQTLLIRLLQPKQGDAKSKLVRLAAVNSEALRRHFLELTSAFLAPFCRYFEAGADGYLPQWDEAEFLFSVRSQATPIPTLLLDRVGGTVAQLVELYGRFVSSINFRDWFMLHRRKLQHLETAVLPPSLQGLSIGNRPATSAGQPAASTDKEDGLAWFKKARQHLDEVQLINLFFELEGQLREAVQEATAPDAQPEAQHTMSRLQNELVTLFLGMDQPDLQLICVSAPTRRDLLLGAAKAVLADEKLQHIKAICEQLA